MTDAWPEPDGPSPGHRRLRAALGWIAAAAAVFAVGWLVVSLAPRPPRPRLVDDAAAPVSSACGSFGEQAPAPGEGVTGYVPCWLPDGFAILRDASTSGTTTGVTDVVYAVYYSRAAGDDTPDTVTVLTLMSSLPPTPPNTMLRRGDLDVAAVYEDLGDGTLQVRWAEDADTNIRVIARGALTGDEVVRIAASLERR